MPTPDSTAPIPSIDSMLRLILGSRVYDVCRETPLDPAPSLSRRLGCTVLFKREDLQPVFSFKLRGAYNRIAHLTEAERARGVIAVSAGNHAQGVAYSARKLGIHAVIVMPQTTPEIKVEAVRRLAPRWCCTATATRTPRCRATSCSGESGAHCDPSVRRPAGDCRAGHHRRGTAAPERARPGGRVRRRSAAAGSSRASPATSRRCGPTCRSSASSRSRPTRCTARCRRAGA